jgi:hypothetical protein
MAIDNPKEKFEQQYMEEAGKSPFDLAIFAGKLAFPKAALPLEIFQKVRDKLTNTSIDERLQTMWSTLVKEVEHVESTKADKEEMERAIHLVMWRAIEELDDRKREHYVKLIGNALKSQDQIRDVISFVHTIEHLTERDLIVLKIINEVMNRKDDWKPQHDSANPAAPIMKLHHSNIISRAQEFARRVAMALGQPVEKNLYNRDVGFEICARLEGFGLAHQLSPMTELPVTDYAYRLSGRGATLLVLLGEGVPNAHHYMSPGR